MLRFNILVFMKLLYSSLYFNTSYVTVQLKYAFNADVYLFRFQYILCYGSTFLYIVAIVKELSYFNTSYVTVQPVSSNAFQGCTAYFNTSYVTVQRKTGRPTDNPKTISIHPMLRFNN